MSDRLFDIEEVPEVPLFREPPPGRGAQIMDERIGHDYPPEWHRCPTCEGKGRVFGPLEAGECDDADLFVWSMRADDPPPVGQTEPVKMFGVELVSSVRHPPNEFGTYIGFKRRNVVCSDCLGMGSAKARVRLEAGHRCERCKHPYVPKGDAKMLGVEPSGGRWSACDERCTHDGPTMVDERALMEKLGEGEHSGLELLRAGAVYAEWRILTVHHLDGDKANLAWWNLAALCQVCHLHIQHKVVMERVYPHEHSAWFKPHAAGWYAHVYLGEQLTREETMERLDELLALERIC